MHSIKEQYDDMRKTSIKSRVHLPDFSVFVNLALGGNFSHDKLYLTGSRLNALEGGSICKLMHFLSEGALAKHGSSPVLISHQFLCRICNQSHYSLA